MNPGSELAPSTPKRLSTVHMRYTLTPADAFLKWCQGVAVPKSSATRFGHHATSLLNSGTTANGILTPSILLAKLLNLRGFIVACPTPGSLGQPSACASQQGDTPADRTSKTAWRAN